MSWVALPVEPAYMGRRYRGNTNASKPAKNSGVQRFRETDGHGTIRMIEEIGD